MHTPYGLNIANPVVEQSFADAVTDLRNAGIPLDAPLRDWQYERRGAERIPIHGGPGGVGRVQRDQRRAGPAPARTPATRNVPHGSSFVMVAQFTGDPDCPVDARTILTYSQSTNPNSPYFADQTRMFSNKQWVDEAYCEDEIAADPNLEVTGHLESATGYPRPEGRHAAARLARAGVRASARRRTARTGRRSRSRRAPRRRRRRATSRSGRRTPTAPPRTSVGFVRLGVQVGAPGPPDDSDVRITAGLTDVRCGALRTGGCGPANAAAGRDYTGELRGARRTCA